MTENLDPVLEENQESDFLKCEEMFNPRETYEKFLPINHRNQELIKLLEAKQTIRKIPYEHQYGLTLLNLLAEGVDSGDRTGVGTKRISSENIHIDMSTWEIPALRGKKVAPEGAFIEMMWIMMGRNDLQFLKDNGVNYWDSWVKEDGTFGPIYGTQMRNFLGVDQLVDNINTLIKNPDSRRILTSLWNPTNLEEQALPPCHFLYHFTSTQNRFGVRTLNLHVMQRSADVFLGVPYDFMLFAYYLLIVSFFTGYNAGQIHITLNDYHMYSNHEKQVNGYLNNLFNDPEGIINNSRETFYVAKYSEEFKALEESLRILKDRSDLKTCGDYFTKDILNSFLKTIFEQRLFMPKNYNPKNHYGFIKADVAV